VRRWSRGPASADRRRQPADRRARGGGAGIRPPVRLGRPRARRTCGRGLGPGFCAAAGVLQRAAFGPREWSRCAPWPAQAAARDGRSTPVAGSRPGCGIIFSRFNAERVLRDSNPAPSARGAVQAGRRPSRILASDRGDALAGVISACWPRQIDVLIDGPPTLGTGRD